jgi:hypothetical protein
LNRRFLELASPLLEPFLAGMGLRVERLTEDMIEVFLPGTWKNRGIKSDIHIGALTALGDMAARLFWEHHLDLRDAEVRVERIEVRMVSRPSGDLRALYRVSTSERESVLYELRSQGRVAYASSSAIYDSAGRLVAEVEVGLVFVRQLALNASSSAASEGSSEQCGDN